MPHIHTEPGQHDLTTTAFIVRNHDAELYGLFHRHKKYNLLMPVGGHVELIETPWAAVLHEILEEAGYTKSQLQILQPNERISLMTGVKKHPVPLYLQTHSILLGSQHHHIDIGFAFIVTELPSLHPADGESQELVWLNAADIAERSSEMPADVSEIYRFVLETAVTRWQICTLDEYDI